MINIIKEFGLLLDEKILIEELDLEDETELDFDQFCSFFSKTDDGKLFIFKTIYQLFQEFHKLVDLEIL